MKQPSLKLLQQTVTIFNMLPQSDKPIHGGKREQWQATTIGHVKYEIQEGAVTTASHGAVSDTLLLMIFPQRTECKRKYIDPKEFEKLNPIDCTDYWTIRKGVDYIALGEAIIKPSDENIGERNDFKVSTVDILFNPSGSIHHFEVYAR